MVQGSDEIGRLISAVETLQRSPIVLQRHPRMRTLSQRIRQQMAEQVAHVTPEDEAELIRMKDEFGNNPTARGIIDQVGYGVHALIARSRGDTPFPGTATTNHPRRFSPDQETVAAVPVPSTPIAPPPEISRPAPQKNPPKNIQESFRVEFTRISALPDERQKQQQLSGLQSQFVQGLNTRVRTNPEILVELMDYLKAIELTDDLRLLAEGVCRVTRKAFSRPEEEQPLLSRNIIGDLNHIETKIRLTPALREKDIAIESYLAKGAMGAVFKGTRRAFGNDVGKVVIKVIQESDEVLREAFQREAVTLARVKGTHIVPMYAVGMVDEEPYLVMDFVKGAEGSKGCFDGQDLMKLIEERHPPVDAIAVVCVSLALGIQETHELNIVHRDLKPGNFLLTPQAAQLFSDWKDEKISDRDLVKKMHELKARGNAIVMLSDFGLAKKFDDHQVPVIQEENPELPQFANPDASPEFTITAPGGFAGTPKYIAPESMLGNAHKEKTDLYALGVIIAELLKGKFPYPLKNQKALGVVTEISQLATGTRMAAPRPSLVLADDPDLANLPPHLQPLRNLVPQLTSLDVRHPEKRGTIREALAVIEPCVDAMSEKGQEAAKKAELVDEKEQEVKIAKQRSTSRGRMAKVFGGLLVAAAIVTPVVISRDREQTRVNEVRTFDGDLEKIDRHIAAREWTEAIALLNNVIERTTSSESLSPDLREGRLVTLREKHTNATAKLEALTRANALIAAGDLLLDPKLPNGQPDPNTPSNLDGALEQYQSALEASDEVADIVKQRSEEIIARRCRQSYARGVRHYNRGEPEMNDRFREVAELNFAGMTEIEIREYEERMNILSNWDLIIGTNRRDCLRVYRITDPEQFRAAVNEWRTAALTGDNDAITKILELSVYMENNQHPFYYEVRGRPGLTPFERIDILRGNPEWVEFEAKERFVDECVQSLSEVVLSGVRHPNNLGAIQRLLISRNNEDRVMLSFLGQRHLFEEYNTVFLGVLTRITRLRVAIRNGDFVEGPGATSIASYIQSTLLNLFMETKNHLSLEERAQLNTNVTTTFAGNQDILEFTDILTR